MQRRFYDIGIRCDSVEQIPQIIALAEKRFGYAGIALLVRTGEKEKDVESAKEILSSLKERLEREKHKSDIRCGVEISASSVNELKRRINMFVGKSDFIAFKNSSDEKVNRAAVQDFRVDFIANPTEGAELGAVDVRFASENAVAFEFNMQNIIKSRRKSRAQRISRMRSLLKFVRKYRAMPLITSGACCVYEMRAPRELIALASLIGMTREEAKSALCEIPEGIITRKWKREREEVIEIVE